MRAVFGGQHDTSNHGARSDECARGDTTSGSAGAPGTGLGRAAAMRIFEAIDGDEAEAGVRHLPVRLVIRGSTIERR